MASFDDKFVALLLSTISDNPMAGAMGSMLAKSMKTEDEGRLFTSLSSVAILVLWMIRKLYGEDAFNQTMAEVETYAKYRTN